MKYFSYLCIQVNNNKNQNYLIMKNIVALLAIATSFVACTSGETTATEEVTVDTTVVVEDTTAIEGVEVEGELSAEVE
jgi:hypothetical protein